jgi:hypothetical protein
VKQYPNPSECGWMVMPLSQPANWGSVWVTELI